MSIRAKGEKWTAGPWQASNLWLGPKGQGPYSYPLGTDANVAVANARLIAAAPELYEALDRIATRASYAPHDDPEKASAEFSKIMNLAHAALAKARGG